MPAASNADIESVVEGPGADGANPKYQMNVVKLSLPSNMRAIDDAGAGMHHPIFHVGGKGLAFPPGGFFPLTVGAEITANNKGARYFLNKLNEAGYLFLKPRTHVASIVNRVGDGNSRPFKRDEYNVLYIKLILGATIISSDNDAKTKIGIMLPLDYACKMNVSVVNYDAPETMSVFKDKVPSGRGHIGGDHNIEGTWETGLETRSCEYTFRQDHVLYADAPIYFMLSINNPEDALKQYAPSNKWTLSVKSSLTVSSTEYNTEGVDKLFAADDADSAPSVSVLGKLSEEVIAPSKLAINSDNTLHIFFRTEQTVGNQSPDQIGTIRVDAPIGYDFSRFCDVKQLGDSYLVPEPNYGDTSGIDKVTHKLPVDENIQCDGVRITESDTTYNRAIIYTSKRLLPNSIYGFAIRVTNAPSIPIVREWKLFTYEVTGAAADGSYFPVRFNPQENYGAKTSESLNLYQYSTSAFQVAIVDMRP